MNILNYLLGFIILGLFVVGGTMIVSDLNTNYSLNMSTQGINNTFNQVDKIYNMSKDMDSSTLGGDISDTAPWESMTKGAYIAIRQVTGTYSLINAMITDISNIIELPKPIVVAVMTTITLSIIFALIYLLFRYIPPNR